MADHHDAATAASELLEECWDGAVPVDSVRIAKTLGVKVLNAEFRDEVSGALVKKQGTDPSILLNATDSRSRRRFMCAHELGHFILRAREPDEYEYLDYRDPCSSTGTDEEEGFADSFAASLLMPQPVVEGLLELGLPDFRLANQFGVTHEALKSRLDDLELAQG